MAFLQVPLKKTQAVDLVKPLSNYIRNTFSGEVLNENKEALPELNQMRANAVVKALDKHESSLDVIQRYYDQLCAMEAKLPITENQIRISFCWQDAFDKGSLFGFAKSTLSNGKYEKFCVLFNIAALQSQLAFSQNHSTDDGLKTAAKYYQQSAGIYSHLKDVVNPVLQTLPTLDLSVSCLSALSAIMVAQAQDCFYRKAATDQMKDAVIAKIAMQASDFYLEACRAATHPDVKGMWDKDWVPFLQCKQLYLLAVAEFHQSLVCKGQGSYGEEVARLAKSEKALNDAIKGGGNLALSEAKTLLATVSKALQLAKKDNDLIYLDEVPSNESLSAVGRALLAKATPVSGPLSSNFKDLFTKLVPMAVHQAMAFYDAERAALLNREIGRLREATQFLNGVLASLNLPASIEDASGRSIPASILEKSLAIKEKGGLAAIDSLMENLPELLQRNRELLDETLRSMDEEEREDKAMRDHFKERWSRTPSDKLTEYLRQEGSRFRAIVDNAVNADQIVRQKYNEHRRALDVLSKSESEISAALPTSDESISSAGASAVKELRDLMQQVDKMKNERNGIEEEFKGATVDMQSKFLIAFGQEGALDAPRLTSQALEATFGSVIERVKNSVDGQAQLVEKIQAANEKFVASKTGGGVNPRDQMLKDLAAAFDAYQELSSNLAEGSKFYNDLTEILLKYQNKVNDLIFARKTEKEDLSKDIQQQIAKDAPAPTPQVPAHHQSSAPVAAPRPDRPPPPQRPEPQSGPTVSQSSIGPSLAPPVPARPPQPASQLPQAPSQLPQTASQLPQAPSQLSQTASQLPQAPMQLPQPASQLPQAPSQLPQAASQLPQAASHLPQVASQLPHAPSQSQPYPSQQYVPSAPYLQQPQYMPQPGYYASPGVMQPYVGGYFHGYMPHPVDYQQPYAYGQYVPPYVQQQQPIGYQGYPYQQPPPQR